MEAISRSYHLSFKKQHTFVLLLLGCVFTLFGCGAPFSRNQPLRNETDGMATDQQLADRWKVAQQHLANHPIPINAAVADLNGTPAQFVPADPRALEIAPCCVAVITEQDIPLNDLPTPFQRNGSDPTHIIKCGSGAIAQYCYSFLDSNVHVSNSWVLHDGTTDYEFENVILSVLGYDTSQR